MSYVLVPSEKLIPMCETTMKSIEKERERLLEEALAERMKPSLFFWRGRSREAALGYLKRDHPYFPTYGQTQKIFQQQYALCKTLLRAAKLRTEVAVSASDLDQLHDV